ncbi:sensor histidine kinase [Emticicia sp. CRIBPO]|uniref:sensor histidine kinase n=1 Tax=Emticicia sp. CRIBPO TaxID=2683258 RepID=UPI0014130358|nr:histidine kinase [Emticicia sp. CRIBPO]NBA85196.1 sensor histidine kinase [Emticicia sp. CRIBPO]
MAAFKNTSLAWIYPALWGMVMFNVLRAVTDLKRNGMFWDGELKLHIIALSLTILICYVFSFIWRKRLRLSDGSSSSAMEYLYILAELLISLNIIMVVGQHTGILLMGSGWVDYMLINVTYVPLLLIFYTLIRNNITGKNILEKTLIVEKLKAEKNEAELSFLRSQYHPHFLFNALNTIYFQVEESNAEARQSIEKLSDLLRYQLYDVSKEVTFSQEIRYLRSYIAFQQLRKSERLIVNLDIDPLLSDHQIHPLLFQPLIENAFKYLGGHYEISLSLKLVGNTVRCVVRNTISETGISDRLKESGIGLENLKRRLELLYPDRHSLTVNEENGIFEAELSLHLI